MPGQQCSSVTLSPGWLGTRWVPPLASCPPSPSAARGIQAASVERRVVRGLAVGAAPRYWEQGSRDVAASELGRADRLSQACARRLIDVPAACVSSGPGGAVADIKPPPIPVDWSFTLPWRESFPPLRSLLPKTGAGRAGIGVRVAGIVIACPGFWQRACLAHWTALFSRHRCQQRGAGCSAPLPARATAFSCFISSGW